MATLQEQLEKQVAERERWETRRHFGPAGANNRRLWVLACMDERLPVDRVLGIAADSPVGGGDAHLFRNAGGIVTDDAIRSAALTTNFFGTREIVVLQHTECGMLSANAADLEQAFRDKGIDVDNLAVDPSLPELELRRGAFAKWLGMIDDVDQTTIQTVEYIKNHPLIPKDITISGWIWEVENQRLRKPTAGERGRERTYSTAASFGVKNPQPPRWAAHSHEFVGHT
jgi:carbonic anhydrase